jgi:hypothetical protein
MVASCALLLFAMFVLDGCAGGIRDRETPPMADTHLHFNWDQEELLSAQEAVQRLRSENVVLAIVSSVPSDNAAKLRDAGGEWIIPFYTPYITGRSRYDWYYDARVVRRTRDALASGRYFGIGEVHFISGLGPRRDNKVFLGLLDLAREFDVPVMIHTDASSYEYLLPICKRNPDIRFQWAHAGGVLGPVQIRALMERCSNVWVELSARDPWHYGNFTDEQGKLLPGWWELFHRFPNRFMTGTDPVWNAHQMYRWYEADEGWDHYAQLNEYHRAWLQQLPRDAQTRILLTNAENFLGIKVRTDRAD